MNEATRPGELDTFISIIDDATPDSPSGGKAPWVTYTTATSLWAKVEPAKGGRESFGNPEWTITTTPYWVTMRQRAGISEVNRILFGSIQLHIHAVPRRPRAKYMTLPCSEVS